MRPEKEQIVGLTRDEISKSFGVSEKTAVRWQKHYELFSTRITRLNQTTAHVIRAAHEEGLSVESLAAQHKVTVSSIYRILNNETYREFEDTASVSVSYNPD